MKRALFALFFFLLLALGAGGRQRVAANGDTIPMWNYTVTSSRDGQTYTGTMVGANPFTSPNSTTIIPTQIVPVIVNMPNGAVFDPTAPDPCAAAPLTGTSDLTLFEQSPIFQNHAYTMNGVDLGSTQYLDAFQQANFWSLVGGQSYHTLLSATTLSPVTVTVPSGKGFSFSPPCPLAIVNGPWFDDLVKNTLLPSLSSQGVSPTTFPIFLLGNVTFEGFGIYFGSYHGVVGSPPQTYLVATFLAGLGDPATQDVFQIAQEVAGWMNNPLATNLTPPWSQDRHFGTWCIPVLEVGRALIGTSVAPVTMPNGYTYHLRELPFFSWFMGNPSLGAGGLYSNNETYRGDAKPCPPGGRNPVVPWDAGDDRRADLLWRETENGDVAWWYMDGTRVAGSAPVKAINAPPGSSSRVPLSWQIAGRADVNGDGFNDLIWRHTQNGDVTAWLMIGGTVHAAEIVGSGVPLAWRIAGVGDVDDDGPADLVWHNAQTGDVSVWLMEEITGKAKQMPVVAFGVPLAWQIVAVGDLDADNKTDLIWRHTQLGHLAVWLLDGATVKQGPLVASSVPLAWQIAGVGDVDGDGKGDLVWRHAQTGDVAAWFMNGVTVKQGPVVATGVPLAWRIDGVGDLDGDGKADLLWRHTENGDLAAWLMDGATVKHGPVVSAGVPLAWQIQR
jgi:hypothetical protein